MNSLCLHAAALRPSHFSEEKNKIATPLSSSKLSAARGRGAGGNSNTARPAPSAQRPASHTAVREREHYGTAAHRTSHQATGQWALLGSLLEAAGALEKHHLWTSGVESSRDALTHADPRVPSMAITPALCRACQHPPRSV